MRRSTVAIIGAVGERHRFGNKSLRAHAFKGWDVYPVNPQMEAVEGYRCYASVTDVPAQHLDRITVYLRPELTLAVLNEIAARGCDELWLNPGTHDEAVEAKCAELGLPVVYGCSIVDLGVSPSQFT
jgi:predicted CoA-binding protein